MQERAEHLKEGSQGRGRVRGSEHSLDSCGFLSPTAFLQEALASHFPPGPHFPRLGGTWIRRSGCILSALTVCRRQEDGRTHYTQPCPLRAAGVLGARSLYLH